MSQCESDSVCSHFLRSRPTFASRDLLQPVCSRCRRRARCCLKDQKSQNLGTLKEISKEIFAMSCPWVPGTLHPIAMLQFHPNHCKAQAVQPSENIPMCNNDNVWQRTNRYLLGPQAGRNVVSKTTEAEVAVPAVLTLKQWNPMRNTVLGRGNKSKFRDLMRKHNDFSEMFVCSNSQIQTKGWCDVSGLSHSLAFTNPKLKLLISFLLCDRSQWSVFPSSFMRPCDPFCSVPPRVHTNQTIAPEGHPPAAHLQSNQSTSTLCTYKNHQTARPINNSHSIDVHIHVCTHTYFSICYAKLWNEFQCDAKPPRNSTRNPCVSPWRQFQCLHAGNQNLCRCQR